MYFSLVAAVPDSCLRICFFSAVGDAKTIQSLVGKSDVNAVDQAKGWTPLHYAASYGSGAAVQALLAAGAKVQVTDGQRRTPLHLAAASGDAATVRALLSAGANKTATDQLDRTPEALARAFNKTAALDALGAPPDENGEPKLEFLTNYAGGRQVPELPTRDPAALQRVAQKTSQH